MIYAYAGRDWLFVAAIRGETNLKHLEVKIKAKKKQKYWEGRR